MKPTIIIVCNNCGADLVIIETHTDIDGSYVINCEPCECESRKQIFKKGYKEAK